MQMQMQMISNRRLADVARAWNLSNNMHISSPSIPKGLSGSAMATLVEAVFGAVYLDSGKDMVTVRTAFKTMGLHQPNLKVPDAVLDRSADEEYFSTGDQPYEIEDEEATNTSSG